MSENNGNDSNDEISLLDLAIVLVKRKRLVLGLPAVAAIVAIVASLLLPNIYTASTKILPPQQSQSSASAMLSQLGGLIGGAAGGLAGIKNPNDLYIAMLKSRTMADVMIKRFDLMKRWDAQYASSARTQLASISSISAGKDGIITIEVEEKDPKLAAAMANAYVDELIKLTNSIAVTEAGQRRLFYEKQFNLAKENLARAEGAAKQAMDKGGISMVDEQGKSLLEATAQLRAQIAVKEVQIGTMRGYAAEKNPDLLAAQQHLAALRSQLAKIQGSGNSAIADTAGSGEKGSSSVALLRDVKYHQVVFEMLAKQYELAKIDEAKDTSIIQVLDPAIEPDRKSKPKRSLIVLIAVLAAGFLAVLWAFLAESMQKAGKDPARAERLSSLRRYLR